MINPPTAERLSDYATRYTWSGTAPYDVWLNGQRMAYQSTATVFVVEHYGEDVAPWIEVLDATDTDPAQSLANSPRLRLQWRGQTDANVYLIQRWDGTEWETKAIRREDGTGYFSHWTTPELHGTTARWRVIAQDARGYESEMIAWTQLVVCNPKAPAVTGSVAAGDLTVEAA